MALDRIVKRILTLDQLLREKRTGTMEELAEKLVLSRRQTYNYLQAFEKAGRRNKYDHSLQSYIYTKNINTNE